MSDIALPSREDARHVVRLHLWLEAGRGVSFGRGRLLLLEEIQKRGSLSAASESLGMSYRAAWGKIKSSERLLGQALLAKQGGNRSGYVLTPFGRELLDGFKAWSAAVEHHALEVAARYLPVPTRCYQPPSMIGEQGNHASDS